MVFFMKIRRYPGSHPVKDRLAVGFAEAEGADPSTADHDY